MLEFGLIPASQKLFISALQPTYNTILHGAPEHISTVIRLSYYMAAFTALTKMSNAALMAF
jgi:hypothetical protein